MERNGDERVEGPWHCKRGQKMIGRVFGPRRSEGRPARVGGSTELAFPLNLIQYGVCECDPFKNSH
jgi:hypothetical protein